jgi:hypothetical protein
VKRIPYLAVPTLLVAKMVLVPTKASCKSLSRIATARKRIGTEAKERSKGIMANQWSLQLRNPASLSTLTCRSSLFWWLGPPQRNNKGILPS